MPATLTRTAIDALIARARKPGSPQLELLDEREAGLRFRAGALSAGWSLNIRLKNGKRSRIKLGTWPTMGIAQARTAARLERARIESGEDPNEQERVSAREAILERRKRDSLKDVLDDYEKAVLSQHRRGAQTRLALDGRKGLLRTLVTRKTSTILRSEIAELVKKHARTAPIAANRNLAYASAFFNWCVEEEIIPVNPAEKMRKPSRENERDRFHTLEELKEIWAAAGSLGYPFQHLYRLLIALPMRREEIAGMPVADLTLGDDAAGEGAAKKERAGEEAVWILPAARTKRGNALRVPLSSLARSLLKEALEHSDRPKDSDLVFTTTSETAVSGFTKAKRRLDKLVMAARIDRAGGADPDTVAPMPHWTVHDLRTTFNTHACEILGVPPHVADRILNHVATATRSKIMRVYNKSELFEPRRQALEAWAALLAKQVAG